MVVSIGINERDGGTLYNTQLLFDADGTLIQRRRKISPTFHERMIWGQGDGSGLRAVDSAVGPARTMVRLAIGTREYTKIRDAVAAEATNFAPVAFAEPTFNKRQSNRIYDFIATQMRAMGPDDFVEMLRSAIKQDEWLLFFHGGVLGLFAGFLHLAIFGV